MRGSDAVEGFHRFKPRFIEPRTAIQASRHNGLEADGCQVLFRANMPSILELRQAIADRFRIVGHTFEAAFVQQVLAV